MFSKIHQILNQYLLDKKENTFNDIKEELVWKNEDKSNKFIVQMIDYFNIKEKK